MTVQPAKSSSEVDQEATPEAALDSFSKRLIRG